MSSDSFFKSTLISDEKAEDITRVEELAYELKVEEVMTANPATVTPFTSMSDVLILFRQKRISGAPVLENERLIGLISIEDLLRCLQKSDLEAETKQYMSTDLLTIKNHEPVIEALKLFSASHYGRLPVVDGENNLVAFSQKGILPVESSKQCNGITVKKKSVAIAPATYSRILKAIVPA